jgi:hypothetical protein
MAFKTGLVIGLGVGYVLGAKAGRDRYEQIVEGFHNMTGRPEVQDLLAKGKGLMDQANKAARGS